MGGQGPAGPRSLPSLAQLQSHGCCASTTVLHSEVCTSPRRGGGRPGACLLPSGQGDVPHSFVVSERQESVHAGCFPWINALRKPTEKLLSFLKPGLGNPRMSLPQHSIGHASD